MKAAWVFLLTAGIAEWGWPVGLKLGWSEVGARWHCIAFAVVCMAVSGWLLLLAQRKLAMGTAYAVWTGIGAVGAFFLGVFLFGEAVTLKRFVFVGIFVTGIDGLKLVS